VTAVREFHAGLSTHVLKLREVISELPHDSASLKFDVKLITWSSSFTECQGGVRVRIRNIKH